MADEVVPNLVSYVNNKRPILAVSNSSNHHFLVVYIYLTLSRAFAAVWCSSLWCSHSFLFRSLASWLVSACSFTSAPAMRTPMISPERASAHDSASRACATSVSWR
eukprot:366525-Chlamydomonas_euryale.AAC.15